MKFGPLTAAFTLLATSAATASAAASVASPVLVATLAITASGTEARQPMIAVNHAGDFVVAWQQGDSLSGADMWVRSYAADGTPRGPAYKIAEAGTLAGLGLDGKDRVSALVDGTDCLNGGTCTGYLLRYDADGTQLGATQQVFQIQATGAVGKLATNDNGLSVVGWTVINSTAGVGVQKQGSETFVSTYDADGQPLASAVSIDKLAIKTTLVLGTPSLVYRGNKDSLASLAINTQGQFVAAFGELHAAAVATASQIPNWAVTACSYDANGAPLTAKFTVQKHSKSAGYYTPADIQAGIDAQGDIAIASLWTDSSYSTATHLRGQWRAADGSPSHTLSPVQAATSQHYLHAALAMGSDGRFALAWSISDNSTSAVSNSMQIYAQGGIGAGSAQPIADFPAASAELAMGMDDSDTLDILGLPVTASSGGYTTQMQVVVSRQ